jgi:addiction module HigA family antidote
MAARTKSGPGKAIEAGIELHDAVRAHPGRLLAVALKEGLGLSVAEAARQLGVSRQQLHKVLAGRAGITPDLALRIGDLAGNGARIWLDMQSHYDLAQARLRRAA